MKTENKVLMAEARTALKGKWGLAIGGLVLSELVSLAAQIIPLVNMVAPLLIGGSMALGIAIFYLGIGRNKQVTVGQVFDGFARFGTALGTFLLSGLFIFLWALLLIIPGIIAALSYSQIYFILADNPDIGPMEAIRRSKEMMRGNKWKLFCLGWRFFGWVILAILTLGIGFLWLVPYMAVSYAKFYDDIKNNVTDKPIEVSEEKKIVEHAVEVTPETVPEEVK